MINVVAYSPTTPHREIDARIISAGGESLSGMIPKSRNVDRGSDMLSSLASDRFRPTVVASVEICDAGNLGPYCVSG
jgi:hypothetical protein